jgi:hypothetical protein
MAAAVLLLTVVGLVAYQRGRRHGRVRMPVGLVAELRGHKLHCMGELPERVALEIELLCASEAARPYPAP